MLIELHTLTAHGPSNLNRDDFERPKSALFGGTERARISSQSLKRAIRMSPYLKERLRGRISIRSRNIPKVLYDRLIPTYRGEFEKRLQSVCEAVTRSLGKPDKRGPLHTTQVVFLTPDELGRLEKTIRSLVESDEKLPPPKELTKRLATESGIDRPPHDAVDMALFGRMTTEDADTFASVEGAMQVMHPISTHVVFTEMDYFTAFDDVATHLEAHGSAHVDEIDFNSAVYYKYFSCDFDLLSRNLNDSVAALEALTAFLDAACRISPTGMQNSFASHSLASVALLVVRDEKVPCSLADAFEQAVPPSDEGYLARSLQRLASHYTTIARDFGLEDRAILYHRVDLAELPLLKPISGLLDDGFEKAAAIPDLWEFLQRHVPTEP